MYLNNNNHYTSVHPFLEMIAILCNNKRLIHKQAQMKKNNKSLMGKVGLSIGNNNNKTKSQNAREIDKKKSNQGGQTNEGDVQFVINTIKENVNTMMVTLRISKSKEIKRIIKRITRTQISVKSNTKLYMSCSTKQRKILH